MNESLVKYLSGLLDADGCLSFKFRRDDNKPHRIYMSLMVSLASSEAIDRRGFIETLPTLTGFGVFSTTVSKPDSIGKGNKYYRWDVAKSAHLEMLLPRLIKHMVIKAQHWQWMLETWREQRSKPLSAAECDLLRALSKASRETRTGPIKPKNHPSWAWLAGFLDGDGHYTHIQTRHEYGGIRNHMRVGCVAHRNDRHVLEFIQKACGGHIGDHTQTKSVLVWVRSLGASNRSFALRFLPSVAKHSRLKRHKIDQMIHYHQQRLSAPTPAGEATV
jgi:hypothetical protein